MLSFAIAVRFLRKSLAQSLLIAAGIAIGIGVQVFLGSLITSLQDDLVQQTIGNQSQVTVRPAGSGTSLRYTEEVRAALSSQSAITTQVPVRQFSALLSVRRQTTPLRFTAGEPAALDTIYDLDGRTVAGVPHLDAQQVVLGQDLAETLNLDPGSVVTLVLADESSVEATVTAVVDFGSAAANSGAGFASADLGRTVLAQAEDEYSAVQTQVADPFASAVVADALRGQAALSGLTVAEWQAENEDLLSALQAQSSSSYTIQFFVLLAVALGIASTLAISAVQKTRQIGILKAMGMHDRQAGYIFFWQAAVLGICGAAAGVAVGIALIVAFGAQGATFAISPQWGFTALSFVVGVSVALLSSLIPSRRTSKLDPIEVIQGG